MSLDDLSDAEIEKLWLEEASLRDDEIHAGKVELRPAEEVLRDAKTRPSVSQQT